MSGPSDLARIPTPWSGSYPPGVPLSWPIPAVGAPRLLQDAVRDFPSHPALVVPGEALSFLELSARVEALAAGLADDGVRRGDRLLLAVPDGPLLPVGLLAAWHLGASVAPVPVPQDAGSLAETARRLRVDGVVGAEEVVGALRGRPELAGTATFVVGPGRSGMVRVPQRLRERWRGRGRARDRGPAAPFPPSAGADPGDHALVVTGEGLRRSSPVVFRHRQLVAGAFQTRLWVPDVEAGRERVLVVGPLADPVTLVCGVLAALLSAATIVIGDGDGDGDGDGERGLAAAVERARPTLLVGPSSAVAALNATGGGVDLRSLRVVLTWGPVLPPEASIALERRTSGARLRYGVAPPGTASFVLAQPVYGRVGPGTSGVPLTATGAMVVDPADPSMPLPPGEPGRLLVAGPQLPEGGPEEGVDADRGRQGRLVTDEVAVMDDQGVFRLAPGPRDEDGRSTGRTSIRAVRPLPPH